jgi:predicted nucleotidyltransferase
VADSNVTDAEITFLKELVRRRVKFMVVGMSAAVIQGADLATDDIDLWFQSLADRGLEQAARAAGGVLAWRARPPVIAGKNLDHIDIVTRCDGLGAFESEYDSAIDTEIFGVQVKVLPLKRIIASKQAANRLKDRAALPALKAAAAALRRTKAKR